MECPSCGAMFRRTGSFLDFLGEDRRDYFRSFLKDYTCVRKAEGRGAVESGYYRKLPAMDKSDPLAWQWRIRAKTFQAFQKRILKPLGEKLHPSPESVTGLKVLDLGAGVGWLSYRLAEMGHSPCSVDINTDDLDGLGAITHYTPDWPVLRAEFDRLPLAPAQADMALFNASLHYSPDYENTLTETLRVLKQDGLIVVLDSPVYNRQASGHCMVAERRQDFLHRFGTPSDAVPSQDFLTWDMLRDLENSLNIQFKVHRVWYGWKWALRPVKAALLRNREPSKFVVLTAKRKK